MRLAAIGSNCIDYYNNLDGGKSFAGGGPVNMAVYAVRLGGEASYIGARGNDENGKFIKESLERKKVDISQIHVLKGKTAVSQVELVNGERIFGEYDEGVLKDYSLTDEDISFIKNFDVVVCDVWGRVEKQFPQLKENGIIIAFDCATTPDAEESQIAIPYSDYLFFSSDDGDTAELREKMKLIHQKGPTLVISMLGEQGSLCFDGETFYKYGIVPCENLVDTMGAGDSYIAGFLTGIVQGQSIEKAMEMGASCSTETLGYFGAW